MDCHEVLLTLGCKGQTSPDILASQLWKVGLNLTFGHPRGKVRKNIRDRDSHPTDARLTTALSRFDRDDLGIVHIRKITWDVGIRKPTQRA